jgi:hypothetical protein
MASHDLSTTARKEAADKGYALPDGSFPIRDRTELAKAILAIGRASDPQAAKRHIIKRARALGATDLLPKAWHVTA